MTGGDGESIWEEPAIGGYPPPELFGLPGIERMRAGWESRMPIPPIAYLVEMPFRELSVGHAAFEMPASPWFTNSAGVVTAGMLAVLADAPLGGSIHTQCPPGVTFTTAELSLTFLRPIRADPDARISGSGHVIHHGRSVALSEAFMINEASDELVCHGTSRCSMFPPVDPLPDPPGELPVIEQPFPGSEPDHPLRRPLEGEALDDEIFARMSGLEIVRAQLAGELPVPPLHYLTGIRPVEVSEGRATCALPCSPWLATSFRTVQGGFTALLGEFALTMSIFTTAKPGVAIAPLDLKVNFLRPVFPDMRDLTAEAEVIHGGRQIAIASCRITNADGKPVALATGSAMYLPGRPANLIGEELGSATDRDEGGA